MEINSCNGQTIRLIANDSVQYFSSSKNDRLPALKIFERVVERNKKLSLRRDYTDEWYRKLYDTCVTSYHGSRPFFEPHKLVVGRLGGKFS